MTAEPSIVSGLAGRYASALFDLARDERAIDQTQAALETLAKLLAESPDLARLIRSPILSRDEQSAVMAEVMKRAGVSGLAAKFVGLVIANRRLFLLPSMIAAFRVLVSQHKGEVAAEVISAKALSAQQLEAVRARLAATAGREVRLVAKVDPKILGGLIVRVGSRMVDSSLRTKLFNLQNAMKEVA